MFSPILACEMEHPKRPRGSTRLAAHYLDRPIRYTQFIMFDKTTSAHELKSALRRAFLATRSALTPERRATLSATICIRLRTVPEFAQSGTLLTYVSLDDEVDTRNLIADCLKLRVRVACPAVWNNNLVWRAICSFDDLQPGPFGILTPGEECPAIDSVTEHTVVLTPGVAFTRDGTRLGRGGGYFDRYLSSHPVFAIGLAFDCQIAETLPIEAHDRRVAVVVTESHIFRGVTSSLRPSQ